MTLHSIVVGYDASPDAESALEWALDEGARTGTAVTLVYAVEWRAVAGPIGLAPAVWPDDSVREAAEKFIATALARARESYPGVSVSGTVATGGSVAVLVEMSRQARLVVLGRRGHGGFAGLLVGSTSVAVSAHAHCPVVVVRGGQAPVGGPVVVGFDGSDCAQLAVEFGFAEAARRGVELRLVQAWTPPPPRWQPVEFDLDQEVARERAGLQEVAAGWQDKYPEVPATVHVVAGPPAEALIGASQGAQLVVVGSRGRGGFRGLLLGSVSQQLLHHAHSPVVVIRQLPA
ncbi:universal stress protein [Phytohabitans sp. ZYX-F-186]|uniref:Universal stress protein n=1 Tax=Phytohabitans maris TaxID=3071409 RepID=A0ABU0ZTW9_9ACTN|nr:universal stress protein [Phytohabitans sp. ZYX-F-186]MDQ7910420.1 universal stress protein [Phytohabitans sp. ZYX-F-186]